MIAAVQPTQPKGAFSKKGCGPVAPALMALKACASVWPLVATLHPAEPAVHAGVFANGSAAWASTSAHVPGKSSDVANVQQETVSERPLDIQAEIVGVGIGDAGSNRLILP